MNATGPRHHPGDWIAAFCLTATSLTLFAGTRAILDSGSGGTRLPELLAAGLAAAVGVLTSAALAPTVDRMCADATIAFEAHRNRLLPASITGALYAAATIRAHDTAILPAWFAASTLCIWAAWIDYHTLRVPLALIRITTAVTLVLTTVAAALDHDWHSAARALAASTIVFTGYLLFAIATRGYPGLADVRLSFTLGMLLGWSSWATVLLGFFAAHLLAITIQVPIRLLRHGGKEFPFAPFLVAGSVIALAFT